MSRVASAVTLDLAVFVFSARSSQGRGLRLTYRFTSPFVNLSYVTAVGNYGHEPAGIFSRVFYTK